MTSIKVCLTCSALALAALPSGQARAEPNCGNAGTITIAEMTWASAGMLAQVTQRILQDGFGCDTALQPGDTVPVASSMLTRSQPDIAPELWVSTAQSVWDQMIAKGNVYKASNTYTEGGIEGWWVPDYMVEANPKLKSVTDLAANWKDFADPSNPEKGRFYGCPPGWGCEIISDNLFKALDLGKTFEVFSTGSGENLKASIARAVAARQPFVGWYWGPTEVIGKYKLVRLDMPAYDPVKFKCLTQTDCANPEVTGWAPGEVAVAATTRLRTDAPDVATFLSKMTVPNNDMNAILAWADDASASPEETAQHFFQTYPQVWKTWVPADVAQRVEAKLAD